MSNRLRISPATSGGSTLFATSTRVRFVLFFILMLGSCTAPPPPDTPSAPGTASPAPMPTRVPSQTPSATAAPRPLVPEFEHIVIVVLENKEFGVVYGSAKMPYFNQLVRSYTLLTQHYAVAHPSLPNYLAMIGGDTFGITFDCDSCIVEAQTLPDLIEASGRTWKTYQEDMPSPCYPEPYAGNYAIKHNPFLYFKAIRLDANRCARSVVPFTQLASDFAA